MAFSLDLKGLAFIEHSQSETCDVLSAKNKSQKLIFIFRTLFIFAVRKKKVLLL